MFARRKLSAIYGFILPKQYTKTLYKWTFCQIECIPKYLFWNFWTLGPLLLYLIIYDSYKRPNSIMPCFRQNSLNA